MILRKDIVTQDKVEQAVEELVSYTTEDLRENGFGIMTGGYTTENIMTLRNELKDVLYKNIMTASGLSYPKSECVNCEYSKHNDKMASKNLLLCLNNVSDGTIEGVYAVNFTFSCKKFSQDCTNE